MKRINYKKKKCDDSIKKPLFFHKIDIYFQKVFRKIYNPNG